MERLGPVVEMDESRHVNRLADEGIMADSDALILVDEADRRLGQLSKEACHEGRGELLVQQRAPSKRLWPLYWSNSCCSHPRSTESMAAATRRRLNEELGIGCTLEFLFKFQYHAQFDETGAEHELCSVFIGRCDGSVEVNREEIHDWRWMPPDALQREMSSGVDSSRYTPWFVLEWTRVWRDYRPAVLALTAG
jgi:isopentenyl-diphosphate delta-isomerase